MGTVAVVILVTQREQQRYRSQLQECPFLRGLGRHDTQLEPRHPRRNQFAPLSQNKSRPAAEHPQYVSRVGARQGGSLGYERWRGVPWLSSALKVLLAAGDVALLGGAGARG